MTPDLLAAAPTAESLPEEEQHRLAQILDEYLTALERGAPVTPEELLSRHPAEAEYLRGYLSGLELFHAAAAADLSLSIAPPPAILPLAAPRGQMIGEFEIVSELGRGGMGVVYEAVQTSLGRRVALKVLPISAAADAKQIGRFKNEAQAAAQVPHPNIVPVYAVGEADGVHYFAMQLIEGQSLARVMGYAPSAAPGGATTLRGPSQTRWDGEAERLPYLCRDALGAGCHAAAPQHRTLAQPRSSRAAPAAPAAEGATDAGERIAQLARYGRQAAEALHAAHEYGVIHRDVKPSNLLVDRRGKLWVADFGLARRDGADLTRTGDVCGTMRYMSPEQALGQASLVDHRTDIYSLGVTLYELAAGRHPAGDAGDLRQLLARSQTAAPLRRHNPRVPRDFETIVMKAIAEARGDRYGSAQELADDLGRFLAGEPIRATPPTRLTRLRKWAGRRRRSVVVAACAAAAALGLGVASLSYVAGARSQLEQAKDESRASSQQARRMLYDMPLSAAEQLAAIPGAEGVRRELLENSLLYYTELTKQAFGDPALGADLALAFSKVGGIRATMGDREKALAAYREAERMLAELAAGDPTNRQYPRSLALCRNQAALVLADLGRGGEAQRELEAARALQQSLRAREPADRQLGGELATTLGNLGLAAATRGDATGAAAWYQAAIDLHEQLLPGGADAIQSLDDEPLARSLAASYNNLASLRQATDVTAAQRLYRAAAALQRALVSRRRWNQTYQSELAGTYNNLGYCCALAQDWAGAQRAYADAIELQTHLVEVSPAAVKYRRDLAVTANNLGMALSAIGRQDEAARAFELALARLRPLARDGSRDAAALSAMGGVYNNLGMLHEQRLRAADADRAYQRAIDYQKQALALDPTSAAFRELLARHYDNFARNLREQGKLAAATEIAALRQQLLGDAPARAETIN
jgi:serine/threonine protein kinase/tetratricopeptide (TPR) repeat protein